MRKRIYIIICIFMLVLLSGCGITSADNFIDLEQRKEYFGEKNLSLTENASFTFSYDFEGYAELNQSEAEANVEIEGRVIFEVNSIKAFYYEAEIEYDQSTLATDLELVAKEAVTYIYTSDDDDSKTYINIITKSDSNNYETESNIKTTNTNKSITYSEMVNFIKLTSILNDITSSISDNTKQVFVKEDKCVIVISTYEEHKVIELTFDGNNIRKIKYNASTATSEEELIINFENVYNIEIPKDHEDYK